jgi:ABC-type lipoprotein release transport system permease subunit
MPETVRGRVGGIFETGMYEIDNTLVVMALSDVESAMGVGATGIEVKLPMSTGRRTSSGRS